MGILGYILLFLGMLAGLAIIPFGLPGAGVILLSVFIYALLTDFNGAVGVVFFIILCVLTAIAETADNWLTALGARSYGASTGSMWLSLLGGLIGAIVIGGPLAVMLGPLGPVAGGFAGAFSAVFLGEYYRRNNAREALRAGWGTFVGRMAGMALKLVIAIAMVIAVAMAIVF
jgi:uncharacterized protein YqgC (DUF456 family)